MRGATLLVLIGLLSSSALAQEKQIRHERRPAQFADLASANEPQKQPNYDYFSILDGMPMLLELHIQGLAPASRLTCTCS
jgi:hypothetical protein